MVAMLQGGPQSLPLGTHTLLHFPCTLCQSVSVTNGGWQKWYLSLPRLGYKSHMHAESLWLCLTLCNRMGCSPPGSSVHVILQCSCLENPRDGGAWWAAIYGVAQRQTRLKRLSSSSKAQGLPFLHFLAIICYLLISWRTAIQRNTKCI